MKRDKQEDKNFNKKRENTKQENLFDIDDFYYEKEYRRKRREIAQKKKKERHKKEDRWN